MTTRRALLVAAAPLGLAAALSGCTETRTPMTPDGDSPRTGRASLSVRPDAADPSGSAGAGEHELGVADERDTLLYVPPEAEGPMPLVVSLHGAGGSARGGADLLRRAAREHGFAVLAPASRGSTWDAVGGDHGPDVAVLDRSLRRAFELVRVDPERISVAGFSDGASYALGLGLANGDLFGGIAAFSPGFVPPAERVGEPRVFVSHGVADEVLPIGRTSRRIVPALERDGYDVTFVEFDGGHTVPPDMVEQAADALRWSSGRGAP